MRYCLAVHRATGHRVSRLSLLVVAALAASHCSRFEKKAENKAVASAASSTSTTSTTSSPAAVASSDSSATSTDVSRAEAGTSASTASSAVAPPSLPLPREPDFIEGRRGTLFDLGYLTFVESISGLLHKRFGDDLATLSAQAIKLDGDRRAVFLWRPQSGLMPILVALDSNGAVAWIREQALGGVHPGVEQVALAPGAQGEMIVAFHDPVARVVGARRWAADGMRIMDLVILDDIDSDALSVVYWPSKGWLVVNASHGAVRAQLIDPNARPPWGNSGRAVSRAWLGPTQVTAVLDTDESALLFFHGFTPGTAGAGLNDSKAGSRRIDATGTLRFPSPIVVVAVPLPNAFAPTASTRVDATRSTSGAS
ncbi:MAG: hypothetical protein U0165_18615 [Polyangiaceae bacterium]